MVDLKACFENLGLQDVQTVLQSGNVLFTSAESTDKLKALIEEGLTKTFGYPAHIQVMSTDRLHTIIAAYPFQNRDSNHHDYVIFFEDGLEQQLASQATTDSTLERIQAGSGVIYWRIIRGMTLKSTFAAYLTKAPYKNAHTNRNIRTLIKVLDAKTT
jgi:uncharacterized protein (DUF1697 family)